MRSRNVLFGRSTIAVDLLAVGGSHFRLSPIAQLGATLVLILILLGGTARAQTRTWDGGGAGNNWSTAGNWSSNNVPDGTGEAALFTNDPVGQTKLTPNLSADVTIGQLQFSATAPSYTISGTGPSTLFLNPAASFGGVGITVASGAANQTISAAEVEFLSSQSWDIGGTTTLSVSSTIEDAAAIDYGLTKNGTGTLVFPGDVRYDGATAVNDGALILSFSNTSMLSALTVNAGLLRATTSPNALGSSSTRNTITLAGGALELANDTGLAFGHASRNTIVSGITTIRSDRLTAGAGVTHTMGLLRIGAQTLSVEPGGFVTGGTAGITFDATTLAGNATFHVANGGSAGAQLTLGAIGQTGGVWSLTKTGDGTLALSAAISFTGETTVEAGKLSLASRGLADSADIFLSTGSALELKFSGVPDVIDSLFIDGVSQPVGTWGAAGSGAQHTSSLITGPGWLQISTFILAGDFNNDGKVDAADYIVWRNNLGDADETNINHHGDGLNGVDEADFDVWKQHFGQSSTTSPGESSIAEPLAAIPEPATNMMLSSTIVGISLRRRRAVSQLLNSLAN